MFGKKKKKKAQKKQRTSLKSAAPSQNKKQGSKAAPGADKKGTDAAAPKKAEKPSLTHSDEFENSTSGEVKPIVIKGKGAAPKRTSRRELQRVAKVGGYTVFDGPRTGKTFATPQEAKAYAVDVLIRTGEPVEMQKTDRQVTHTFKAPNTEVK